MDSSDDNSDSELFLTGSGGGCEFPVPEHSQLKPKLDSIFAEVEKNLPSIDFDLSDVSSDNEDQEIFHRSLFNTSLFDDDKDLDTSQCGDTFSGLFQPNIDSVSLTNVRVDVDTQAVEIQGNVAAAAIGQPQRPRAQAKSTSWTEVVIDSHDEKDKFKERKTASNNVTKTSTGTQMDEDLSPMAGAMSVMEQELDNEDKYRTNSTEEELEKHEKESTSETASKVSSASSSRVGTYNSGDKRMNKLVTTEEIRRNEKKLVSNMVPTSAPKLLTNNLNIDLILCSLDEEHRMNSSVPPVVREAWARQQRIQSLIGAGEGSNRFLNEHREEESTPSQTLIQRLAEFSMTQSGEDMTDIDPLTGAKTPRDTDADVIETDNRSKSPLFTRRKPPPEEQKVEKKTTSTSCGTNTNNNDGPLRIITPTPKNKLEAEKNPESKRERETVFIDLRNHDQKVKEQQQIISRVQQVLHISHESESSSDSDSEDDMQTWFEQRRRLKQTLASRGVNADALPNKPKPKSAEPFKHPNRVINLSELDNRLVAKIKPETTDEELSEEQKAALEKERKIKEEERERQKKIEEARKQREEREAERQSRLRLAKRLEVLRPTASVSGKQDCAETTPVMFDLEASYEPSPSTLPPFLPSDKEILLLTIHLSSNGEIILHRGKSKSVDTGLGLSASYTVLLTWLLSMVPENYDFLIKKPEELEQVPFYPPFYVLGMQQLLMDEDLCLVVAVTPHPLCDTKGIPNKQKKSKTKLKDEVKNNSPFQQFLTKFLSTNTLHTVCPWLQAVVPIDISCPSQDPEDTATYVYRAPLPIITTKPLSTFIQMNPDPQAAQKVFNTPVGFFWQTVDNEESSFDHGLCDSEVNYDTQVTMSLVYKKIFQEPPAMSGIFNKIMQEGLDLSGVRLLYPVQELLDKPSVPNQTNRVQSNIEFLNKVGPVLALGLRGTFARAIWLDAVGPTDPALARRTDPNSLCALYGGASRDECLLFSPRNPSRVHSELTRWFAGRVPPGGVIDVGTPYTRKDHLRSGSPKGQKAKKTTSIGELTEERPASGQSKKSSSHHSLMDSHPQHRPPAALTATTTSEIILVISPVVRPQYIGIIMASCQRKGFRIRGVRRQKLTAKKVACLGIDSSLLRAFCPGISDDGVPSQASKHAEATSPCFLLLLEKENGAHNAASLIESCMIQLTLKGLMENMQSTVDHYLESKHMFYSARYSDNLLVNLGGDFSKCVDHEIQVNPNFVVPKLYTNPEMEQIVILILLGHEIQKNSGMFVGKLLGMIPFGKLTTVVPLKEGFELLGMKWLPGLTTSQAKEVTPCEVGDRLWKDNIHTLVSEPALVLALRGIDAFRRLEAVVPLAQPGRGKDSHIDYIMSRNAEESYGFARAFFTDKEIFSDPTARHLLMFLPQVRHHIQGFGSRSHSIKTDVMTESMFDVMLSGPQPISTLLVIKPRAVKKHLTKILRKVMLEGFTMVGLRLGVVSQDEELVSLIDEEGELDSDRLDQHKKYLSSGPSLILALERENAVKKMLDLLGPCDPLSARRQSQFLWRGTFGMDTVANGLHSSQNFPHAVQELKLFFKDGLCCNETDELRDLEIIGPAVDSLLDMTKGDKRIVQITSMQGDTDHSAIEIQLLLQTTCIVLKPPVLKIHDRGHYAYVDIVEELLKQEFEIVGARMVWFTQEQAEVFLHIINAGSYKQVPMLLAGPSLVFALQRDNAVLSFDSILGSDFGADSIIGKYGGGIFRPADIKQAHRMLGFFFDELMPGSQIKISPKDESVRS